MNYELAKQLKDAGFPYKEAAYPQVLPSADFDGITKRIPVPTLSELIAACDGHFIKLERIYAGDSWEAGAGFAKTPEEAVAKLWLALNAKQ